MQKGDNELERYMELNGQDPNTKISEKILDFITKAHYSEDILFRVCNRNSTMTVNRIIPSFTVSELFHAAQL
jgi:hypothetical protein